MGSCELLKIFLKGSRYAFFVITFCSNKLPFLSALETAQRANPLQERRNGKRDTSKRLPVTGNFTGDPEICSEALILCWFDNKIICKHGIGPCLRTGHTMQHCVQYCVQCCRSRSKFYFCNISRNNCTVCPPHCTQCCTQCCIVCPVL